MSKCRRHCLSLLTAARKADRINRGGAIGWVICGCALAENGPATNAGVIALDNLPKRGLLLRGCWRSIAKCSVVAGSRVAVERGVEIAIRINEFAFRSQADGFKVAMSSAVPSLSGCVRDHEIGCAASSRSSRHPHLARVAISVSSRCISCLHGSIFANRIVYD